MFASGEVMSLLEQMNDGIQLIAEVQSGTNNRIDGLEQRFDGLEQRFDGLELKVDRLQDDMTDVKQQLSAKIDRTEFSKLEKRLIKVERVVFDRARVR